MKKDNRNTTAVDTPFCVTGAVIDRVEYKPLKWQAAKKIGGKERTSAFYFRFRLVNATGSQWFTAAGCAQMGVKIPGEGAPEMATFMGQFSHDVAAVKLADAAAFIVKDQAALTAMKDAAAEAAARLKIRAAKLEDARRAFYEAGKAAAETKGAAAYGTRWEKYAELYGEKQKAKTAKKGKSKRGK